MNILEDVLYPVVDEAMTSIESAKSMKKSPDSVLFGADGLDSMGLVSFIVLAEERVDDLTDIELTLANEKAMSRNNSPFLTLQTLADYISECLAEAGYAA